MVKRIAKRIAEATVLLAEFVIAIFGVAWLIAGSIAIIGAAISVSPWFLFAFLLHPIVLAGMMWVDERWKWR